MNVVFLIGNGLDIQNGMKTRYTDFYNYILDQKDTEQINNNLLYKNIKERTAEWSDFEIALGKFTRKVDSQSADKFLDDLDEVIDDLTEYLKLQQENSYLNDEKYNYENVIRETMREYYSELEDKDGDELRSLLKNYGEIVYYFVTFNYTNTIEQIISKSLVDTISNPYNSGYFWRINRRVIHAHGAIDNLMTIGVNDDSQILGEEFSERQKEDLIKPLLLENSRAANQSLARNAIQGGNIFVIFGMSLGVTDTYWWELLAKRVLVNENHRLIINVFDPSYSKRSVRRARLDREKWENAYISKLDNLGLTDEDKEKIRKRIYIIFNNSKVLMPKLREE